MYSSLEAAIVPCPRCATRSKTEVRMYFGPRDGSRYRVGEKLRWTEGEVPDSGGRPPAGKFDGQGHAVCPNCGLSFAVIVHVVSDIIVAVEPITDKKPDLDD